MQITKESLEQALSSLNLQKAQHEALLHQTVGAIQIVTQQIQHLELPDPPVEPVEQK